MKYAANNLDPIWTAHFTNAKVWQNLIHCNNVASNYTSGSLGQVPKYGLGLHSYRVLSLKVRQGFLCRGKASPVKTSCHSQKGDFE